MAETVFTNLRVRGTLALVGAFTAGAVVATTVTGTVGTFSTSVSAPRVYATGGLLPITADLSQTNFEGDGTASGWSIQNPHDEAVFCKSVNLRVVTAPTNGTTVVDIDTGTGTFALGSASGKTLTDSYIFAAGVHTATGSRVSDSSGYPDGFVLDAAGGTTDYILLGAEVGTGGGLVADLLAECYSLD